MIILFMSQILHLDNFYNTELHQIIYETQNKSLLTEHIDNISNIGLLTKKQYQECLDKPLNAMKISYPSKKCNQFAMFFKPILTPLKLTVK